MNEITIAPAYTPANVAAELTNQYKIVEAAKNRMYDEAVKFGTMLIQWEQFLGGNGAGRGHAGEGLKGWLAANCPEINYNSAKVYKCMAAKVVKMLGGGAQVIASLQGRDTVENPNGEVIDIAPEVISRRDEFFQAVQSRRQLEQMWLSFMGEASRGQAGRPAGSPAEYKKLTPVECAVKCTWPIVDHMLKHRGELFHAYQILPENKLEEMLATLEEQTEAIRAELKNRRG